MCVRGTGRLRPRLRQSAERERVCACVRPVAYASGSDRAPSVSECARVRPVAYASGSVRAPSVSECARVRPVAYASGSDGARQRKNQLRRSGLSPAGLYPAPFAPGARQRGGLCARNVGLVPGMAHDHCANNPMSAPCRGRRATPDLPSHEQGLNLARGPVCAILDFRYGGLAQLARALR